MKNLKTFQAETMAAAIDQVKRRLGRDAVILHTRTINRGGWLGLGGRPVVEVTAAASAELPPPVSPSIVRGATGTEASNGGAGGAFMGARKAISRAGPTHDPGLRADLGELRSLVEDLVRDSRKRRLPDLPEALVESYTRLIQADVAEDVAGELVERIQAEIGAELSADPTHVRQRLAGFIENMLPVAGPIRLTRRDGPTVIALVGPTGVGKTTTVAKLAANFRLRERKKVGLITIDTFRIAAVEQLRTYAQIINVPLEAVTSPAQLRGAVERMKSADVILIDTTGRSQHDELKIKELKCFLDASRPHEVHLVLSGTCGRHVLNHTIQRYGAVGVDRVIFTKLDEAVGFGAILSCLAKAETGLSYLTAGQDVPNDIEVGGARRVADLILGGGSTSSCTE